MTDASDAVDRVMRPLQGQRRIWGWSVDEERHQVVVFVSDQARDGDLPTEVAGYEVELVPVPRSKGYSG